MKRIVIGSREAKDGQGSGESACAEPSKGVHKEKSVLDEALLGASPLVSTSFTRTANRPSAANLVLDDDMTTESGINGECIDSNKVVNTSSQNEKSQNETAITTKEVVKTLETMGPSSKGVSKGFPPLLPASRIQSVLLSKPAITVASSSLSRPVYGVPLPPKKSDAEKKSQSQISQTEKKSKCKKCGSPIFWFSKNPNLKIADSRNQQFENGERCVDCDPPPNKLFVRAVVAVTAAGTFERIYELPSLGIGPEPASPILDAGGVGGGGETVTFTDLDGATHERLLRFVRDPQLQRPDELEREYRERCELGHEQAVWAEMIARTNDLKGIDNAKTEKQPANR